MKRNQLKIKLNEYLKEKNESHSKTGRFDNMDSDAIIISVFKAVQFLYYCVVFN